MKTFLILISFFMLYGASAQTTGYSKIISNFPLNAENGFEMLEIPDGYVFVSTSRCLDNAETVCACVTKINDAGDIVWFKQFDFYPNSGGGIHYHQNNLFISGHTNQTPNNFVIYCLNLDGDTLWTKNYIKENLRMSFPHLVVSQNQQLFLVGQLDRNMNSNYEWLPIVINTDLQGDSIKEFAFNDQYNASTIGRAFESTENNLVSSYIFCPDGCFLDLQAGVISMDTNGIINWFVNFPFSFLPNTSLVTQIDSSTLIATWQVDTTVLNYDPTPPIVYYIGLDGQILDSYVYMNETLKKINHISPIWEKGIIGCGSSYIDYFNTSDPELAGWIFRMDENKSIVWDRIYSDTTNQGGSFGLLHIIPTSEGGYIAIGTISNNMTGPLESHVWILKLDSTGCLNPFCNELNYVTNTKEITFLKGEDIVVYPNPAINFTNIKVPDDLLTNGLAFKLISNTGALIVENDITSTNTSIGLNAVPMGVYFLIFIQENEIVASRRIIVSEW